MLVDHSNEGDDDTDLFLDCEDHLQESNISPKEEDTPTISLHALTGTTGYHTMRVQAKIKNQLINILIDTGSTQFCGLSHDQTVGGEDTICSWFFSDNS